MNLVKLTQGNGNRILVNFDNVTYLRAGGETEIDFVGRDMILVKENFDQIDNAISASHGIGFEEELEQLKQFRN